MSKTLRLERPCTPERPEINILIRGVSVPVLREKRGPGMVEYVETTSPGIAGVLERNHRFKRAVSQVNGDDPHPPGPAFLSAGDVLFVRILDRIVNAVVINDTEAGAVIEYHHDVNGNGAITGPFSAEPGEYEVCASPTDGWVGILDQTIPDVAKSLSALDSANVLTPDVLAELARAERAGSNRRGILRLLGAE